MTVRQATLICLTAACTFILGAGCRGEEPSSDNQTHAPVSDSYAPWSLARVFVAGARLDATSMIPPLYWDGGPEDLQMMEHSVSLLLPKDVLAARHKASLDVAQALGSRASRSDMRVVFLEYLHINEWALPFPDYERLILYYTVAHGEEPPEAEMAAGAVKLSPAAGRVAETIVRALLGDGPGSNNGIGPSAGNMDVIVVQFFDGERWQVGQYHNFCELYDGEMGQAARQGLWIFTLLHFIYAHVEHPSGFMWSRFEAYVKALTPSEAVGPSETSAKQ